MNLDEGLILQRATRLTVEIRGSEGMGVRSADRKLECGPHCLAVLDAFAEPISVKEAMARLAMAAARAGGKARVCNRSRGNRGRR